MTSSSSTHRTRFEGLRKILQFNWPFYLVGGILLTAGILVLILLQNVLPSMLFLMGLTGVVLAVWWLVASLITSHWIYDRTGIYDFDWLEIEAPDKAAILTAGFDEAAPGLLRKWPESDWTYYDFYEKETMSEPSIQRARKRYPPSEQWLPCPALAWPCADDSFDLIIFPFSAHELRKPEERTSLLQEARRSIREKGNIVVIEHLRNVPNFLVFGPGAFHFHPPKSWQDNFSEAGFHLFRSRSLGPFVKAYYLEKESD